jgi:hypothetical protein
MTDRYEEIAQRLAAIEEELRDLAYERLAAAASLPEGDDADAAAAQEKRLAQARRAVAKAIGALAPFGTADEP